MSETYNPLVVEHFARPRNVGRFAAGEDIIAASAGDPEQGVRFDLSARVKDDRIVALRFEVYGCPHCIAAGSLLSERLQGATQEQLRRWTWREAADELEFPPEKRGRLLVMEDAVHALAAEWQRRR
ncbi:MAG TPA: iron-sulfur cluster assembly scaffold protein [Steroidobacteraceae bacterium]|nr:iron-sulfur cluster assembly scaffold protein [Steroidobacteraceae bacterium]